MARRHRCRCRNSREPTRSNFRRPRTAVTARIPFLPKRGAVSSAPFGGAVKIAARIRNQSGSGSLAIGAVAKAPKDRFAADRLAPLGAAAEGPERRLIAGRGQLEYRTAFAVTAACRGGAVEISARIHDQTGVRSTAVANVAEAPEDVFAHGERPAIGGKTQRNAGENANDGALKSLFRRSHP
jgi:hypothetical protein